LFDVQIDQIPAVEQLLTQRKFPIVQQVPIVTMRLLSINGQSNEKLRADPEIPEWTLRREYRSTYREKLIESEEVLEGDWSEQYSAGSVVPVSVEEGIAKDLKLKLNDRIIFDVQGVQIETQVTSIRKVDWRRVQTNFFFVFPAGVLEEAPQFFAITTRAPNKHASAEIQRELVYRLPNVSAIDLNLILETADGVLDKAASVITFLALFTLLAGFIVLAGSVAATRSARLRETLLLRTLGATRREIVLISLVEFTVLGLLAAGVGLGLASACSWLLAEYYFQASYLAEWRVVFGVGFSVLGVVILSGIVTSWRLSREIPISVLRVEVS
jgi:putative ABC transport system permease protein